MLAKMVGKRMLINTLYSQSSQILTVTCISLNGVTAITFLENKNETVT